MRPSNILNLYQLNQHGNPILPEQQSSVRRRKHLRNKYDELGKIMQHLKHEYERFRHDKTRFLQF